MKSILLTGATGFIGSLLVHELLKLNYHIFSLQRENINFFGKKVSIIQHDLSSDIPISLTEKNIEIVCHLAAFIPKDLGNINEGKNCFNVNTLGTLKLLEFARNNNSHFIYTSSGNAYKYSQKAKKETDILFPDKRASIYLSSKVAAEILVNSFFNNFKLSHTILRLASVYGNFKKGDVVCNMIKKMVNNEKVEINNVKFGTDLVYIKDVIDALIFTINHKTLGTFNVGTGRRSTILEIFNQINKFVNYDLSNLLINSSPSNDFGFSKLNNKKLSKVMNNRKFIDLENGIRDLWENHYKNLF